MQAQHDYLSGSYPVVREDAAQMCSLQMQAEAGSTMLDAPELVEGAVERFVTKQACLGFQRVLWLQGLLQILKLLRWLPREHTRVYGSSLLAAGPPLAPTWCRCGKLHDTCATALMFLRVQASCCPVYGL